MIPDDVTDIRDKNVKNIIQAIRNSESVTKRELEQKLNLSFATVSNICNSLLSMGLVKLIEDTIVKRSIGRTSKALVLNTSRFWIIALNLQKFGILEIALINLHREIINESVYEYADMRDFNEFVDFCTSSYQSFIDAYKIDTKNIIGVGVVVSGIHDDVTHHTVASEISFLENQPLRDSLRKAFGTTVFVDNDVNLCTLALHNIDNYENMLYLYIGEGTGVGVMQNGNIVRGERGYSPEICHMPLGTLDTPCPLCGSQACLQTDISYSGFLSKYYSRRISFNQTQQNLWLNFVQAVKAGETRALKVCEENAHILGNATSILANLFAPQQIVLGGCDEVLFKVMLPIILNQVNHRKVVSSKPNYSLLYDPFVKRNTLLGAAELVYVHWYPTI